MELTRRKFVKSSFLPIFVGVLTGSRVALGASVPFTAAGALAQAIDDAPANTVLIVPDKTLTLTAPITINGKINLTLQAEKTIVRSDSTRLEYYFLICGSSRNIKFDGFDFDMRQADMPTYSQADYDANKIFNCCISVTDSTVGVEVVNCTFKNLYTNAIYFKNSSDLTVDSCKFYSLVQTQQLRAEHIAILTFGGINSIRNCEFFNTAHTTPAVGVGCVLYSGMANGASLELANLYSEYAGRDNTGAHRVAAFDGYSDLENVHATNITCENNLGMFMRLSGLHNGSVRDSRCRWNANAELGYAGVAMEGFDFGGTPRKGIRDIHIDNVEIDDPSSRLEYAFGISAYDWGAPSERIKITDCSMVGVKRLVLLTGPYHDITIESLSSRDGQGLVNVLLQPAGGSLTAVHGVEADARFDNLIIRENVIRQTSNSIPISLDFFRKGGTTAAIGKILIEDNDITANSGSAAFAAISVQIYSASGEGGDVIVRGNRSQGFNSDWYMRGIDSVTVTGNKSVGATGNPYVGSDNESTIRRGNIYTDGN